MGFIPYQLKGEAEADRVEREWAEGQLRAERKKNLRLGIAERLEVTLARVHALHDQTRVQAKQKEYDESIAGLRAQFETQVCTFAGDGGEDDNNRICYPLTLYGGGQGRPLGLVFHFPR